jgi:hypothetical protein
MKSVNNALIAVAATALSVAAQQATQPQNTQSPAAKQADCTQTTNPLDNKHVQVRTPPALKRHLYRILGSISHKTGVSLNPNDVDPATIAKKASKPCPVTPPAKQ